MSSLSAAAVACVSGYGCGLPLSRLYARFFHGDLTIMSMPNHGLDAFLYLPKLSDEQLFLD